jgi:competence protein ComFB
MKNLLEGAVQDIYAELRAGNSEYCTCTLCQTDVVTFALNHLRPRYTAGTPAGLALTSVDLQRDQTRAALAVAVLDAMRRVASNPRHAAGDAQRGGGTG